MKIVGNRVCLGGYFWAWGAQQVGGAEPDRLCDRCHNRRRRAEHKYRGGRIWLCPPCARHTMERAFGRPLTAVEEHAIFLGFACAAVPMPDNLAALYST